MLNLKRLFFPMMTSSTLLLFAAVCQVLLGRSFWAYWKTGEEWYVRYGVGFGIAALFFSAATGYWCAAILYHVSGTKK